MSFYFKIGGYLRMKNISVLDYYPMIHKDKLLYHYGKDIIRIGTDDNDVVEIKNNQHNLFSILKDLNGQFTIRDILTRHPNTSLNQLSLIITKLAHANTLSVLRNPFDLLSKNERFKSDLTYYLSEGFNGVKILNTLFNLKVTIFGSGGGGSIIALQLANLGIKNIHLIDPDKIDTSNLNRQFMFNTTDIGKFKVNVVKKFILARHSDANITTSIKRITTTADAIKEIQDSNWVFCCIDEPPYISQRIINRASYIKNVPSVYGFSSRDAAKLLIVYPNNTGCVDCLLTSEDTTEFQKLILNFQRSNFSPTTPIVIPNIMLETSWIVKKWLDQVIKERPTGNVLYRFDYNTLNEQRFITFTQQKNCPTCGTKRNESKLWKIIPIQ